MAGWKDSDFRLITLDMDMSTDYWESKQMKIKSIQGKIDKLKCEK